MTQIKRYRAKDWSEASVSLKVFEDESHGLHNVILSLPAGMDIGPDIWRFQKQAFAERQFGKVCKMLEARGFECIQTGTL